MWERLGLSRIPLCDLLSLHRSRAIAVENMCTPGFTIRLLTEGRYREHELRFRIRDNGKGIDPRILDHQHTLGHRGLRVMRERARLMGGTLEIRSQQDAGTEVESKIPAASRVCFDFATCHKPLILLGFMAGTTGLEPATSAVTGQRSNQTELRPPAISIA